MKPFPISGATPVAHDGALPGAADAVVIGGGVIGVCAALFLARAGHSVVLVEKGRIAGEQSSRNWGWIRAQGRDAAELPIAIEARALWRDLAGQVDCDIGLRPGGVAYLAESAAEMHRFAAWAERARAAGLDTEIRDPAGLARLLPGAKGDWPGAMFTASDLRAEPFVAVPALARLAAGEGVTIIEDCAARGLDLDAGRVVGVITERGWVQSGAVVLAGGAWSSLFLRRHGVVIPQLSVRATVAQTAPLPALAGGFQGGAADSRLAFRRRMDGGYTLAQSGFHELFLGPDALRHAWRYRHKIAEGLRQTRLRARAPRGFPDAWATPRHWAGNAASPFEAMRVLDPGANARKADQIGRAFGEVYPQLGPVRLARAWGGMIDLMPDIVPVIDKVAALPGLTIATGTSGHGFGIGPAFGRIAAALATGADPGHDLSRFRLSRFSDGSRIEPGDSL